MEQPRYGMTSGKFARALASLLIAWHAVAAINVHAQQQNSQLTIATDVAIGDDGSLLGRVVSVSGKPTAARIGVWKQGELLAETKASDNGRFMFQGLQAGVYSIGTPQNQEAFRIWTANAAPPKAVTAILIVDGVTARGELPEFGGLFGGKILKTVSNPWVLTGATAVGIAYPLATDDDDAS